MSDCPCVLCGRSGLVRKERVIKGSDAMIEFYCGSCHHTWFTTEGGERLKRPIVDTSEFAPYKAR